jgi:hypothetical protein
VRQRGNLLGDILAGLVPIPGGAAVKGAQEAHEAIPLIEREHVPYNADYKGTKGSYNPHFFKVEKQPLEGSVTGRVKDVLVPRSHLRHQPSQIKPEYQFKDPDVMYQGMSHAQYEEFKRTGQTHQEFTSDLPTAEYDSHHRQPLEHRPAKGKPAYVVAFKTPLHEHLSLGDRDSSSLISHQPMGHADVLRTFKGSPVTFEPGSMWRPEGGSQLHWEELGGKPTVPNPKMDAFMEDFNAAHRADQARPKTEKELAHSAALQREIAWGDKWIADNQHQLGDLGNGWEAFERAREQPGYKALEAETKKLEPTEKELMANYGSNITKAIQKHLPPGWTARREMGTFGFTDRPDVRVNVRDPEGYLALGDVYNIHPNDWQSILEEGKAPLTGMEAVRAMQKQAGTLPANDTSYDVVDQAIREANRRQPTGQVLQFPKPGNGMIGQ